MQTIIRTANIGVTSSQTAINVTATAAKYTPPSGTRGIKLQVQGTDYVWEGGSNVDPATNKGIYWIVGETVVYDSISADFEIYFRCAAGKTSILGVVTW